jgi:purine-nucleoside phosphorylase
LWIWIKALGICRERIERPVRSEEIAEQFIKECEDTCNERGSLSWCKTMKGTKREVNGYANIYVHCRKLHLLVRALTIKPRWKT